MVQQAPLTRPAAAAGRVVDPYEELLTLMHLRTVMWKQVQGRGRWELRFRGTGHIKFGIVVSGTCTLTGVGALRELTRGDFLLLAAPPELVSSGASDGAGLDGAGAGGGRIAPRTSGPIITLGTGGDEPARLLCGHVELDTANANLLLDLVPDVIHLRATDGAAGRTARLIDQLRDEALAERPGSGLVQARLAEVLIIEALRSYRSSAGATVPGLLPGLADPQIALALTALHADVRHSWTVAELADRAHLSRSTFARRFVDLVGAPPIDYLLAWRMALAKDALNRGVTVAQVAAAVGYGSSSAFSSAFHRHLGTRPGHFARTDARRPAGPGRSTSMPDVLIGPDAGQEAVPEAVASA